MSGIGNLQWNDPVKIEKGWIRECLIPIDKRGTFFEYWKLHSSGLKEDGFGVYKKDKDWFVTQYKNNKDEFNSNKKIEPKPIIKKQPVEELPLVLEDVKYKDGLREWQIGSVSKLKAAIKRYGAAVDGSQMGTGKTYSACGLARELNIPFVIVCPKAVKGVWKKVALEHFKLNKNFIGVINYELLSRGRKDSDICSLVKDRSTGRNKIKWKFYSPIC